MPSQITDIAACRSGALGHGPSLIAPRFIKPFVKRHKNGTVDGEATVNTLRLCEKLAIVRGSPEKRIAVLGREVVNVAGFEWSQAGCPRVPVGDII